MAGWLQQMHPLRLQYELFSDANPLMAWVGTLAEQVARTASRWPRTIRSSRCRRTHLAQIVAALDGWRDMSEAMAEQTFLAIYGSPTLQAAVGIDPARTRPLRKAAKSPLHRELLQSRIAELKSRIPAGGMREAVVRGLIYVGMPRAAVDERGFEAIRRIRREQTATLPLAEFKAMVREQFFMLLIDRGGARRDSRRCFRRCRDAARRPSTSSSRC